MSPTLYMAMNNGEKNNGSSTTMVVDTTMANNGLEHRDIRSAFLSSCHGVVQSRVSQWDGDTDGGGREEGVVVGHMACCIDKICLEL